MKDGVPHCAARGLLLLLLLLRHHCRRAGGASTAASVLPPVLLHELRQVSVATAAKHKTEHQCGQQQAAVAGRSGGQALTRQPHRC